VADRKRHDAEREREQPAAVLPASGTWGESLALLPRRAALVAVALVQIAVELGAAMVRRAIRDL